MRRRVLSFFLSLFFCVWLLIPCLTVAAEPLPLEKLRVGVYPFPGFHEENEDGEYVGYGIDYLNEIAKYTSWEYEFVSFDCWDTCYDALLHDNIDIIIGTIKNEKREQQVDFSAFPMASSCLCLYANNSNQDYAYNDYAHFDGMRIGLVLGEARNKHLQTMMDLKGVSFYHKYYDSLPEAVSALHKGEIDTFLGDRLYYAVNEHSVADFGLVDLHFMLNPKTPQLKSLFDAAMEQVLIENPDFNSTLFEKYYITQKIQNPVFTVEEKRYLRAHPRITVWYNERWAPISYIRNGRAEGIAPDILRQLEEICGVTFHFKPMEDKSFKEIVLTQSPDEIICGVSNDTDLLKDNQLTITKSYLDLPVLLVGKQGTNYEMNQSGTVALLRGGTNMQYYVEKNWPNLTAETFTSVDECFSAVSSGRCTFTIQPSYIVNDYLQRQITQALSTVSTSYNFYPLSFGLLPDFPPELYSILNKSISSLSEAEIGNVILENTVSSPYKVSVLNILQKNAWLISIILALVLGSIISYIAWSRKKLARIAYRDKLTNCYSYAGFEKEAVELLSHKDISWALLTLDIDGFKLINNTLGLEEGDKMLLGLTHSLENFLQKDEILCRSSADNFILLLHFSSVKDLQKRMQDFDSNLHLHQTNGAEFKHPILACGICTTIGGDRNLYTMVGNANMARKAAKRSHHSKAVFYNKEMHLQILQEREIENAMLPALRNREFVVYMQPKFNLRTKRIVGAEALIRWQHPSKGLLNPGIFIPLAERNGFITEIDFYVYHEVFRAMRRWIDSGHTCVRVSVNVSRAHLQNKKFITQLCELADEFQIPRQYIECELTESLFSDTLLPLQHFISGLKEAGFWVSIDDFGSGYSSLNMLKEIPVDTLKLDREFFCRDSSDRGKIVIGSIIKMAKSLHMSVISEGVETEDQANMLNALDCDMAQGFLFSKPIPQEEFEAILLEQESAAEPPI